jgi:hypothetical protein
MQIIETNLLRVIVPEKGYKLVNKENNKSFNKVYLGINDSPENYIEVVDEQFVDMKYIVEIDEIKTNNNDNLDMLLLSMAKIYEMVEPFLAMIPSTMSVENIEENQNPLINMYLQIVQRGLMDIEQIPEIFREDVRKML